MDRVQLNKHLSDLEGEDHVSRRHAIQALRHHGEQDWATAPAGACLALVVSLRRQLQGPDPPPIVLKDIAAILGKMGPHSKSAVPQLIALLADGVPDAVRESAVIALGNLGGEARDAVDQLTVLTQGRNALASHAIRALSGIGCADQRVRTALVARWTAADQTQENQLQVAVALCRLGIRAPGLLPCLTHHLMTHSENSLRKTVAGALAWCDKKDLDVVPALLAAALGDKDEEVRAIAQASLKELGVSQEKAIALCVAQLKNSIHAEMALRRAGPLGVAFLIRALRATDGATRLKAARTLGSLGEIAAEAGPALTGILHDKEVEVRLTAAKSLWNVTKQTDGVVPALVDLLQDTRTASSDDAEARRRFIQTVMEALWRIGPPAQAALPALIEKTKDANRLIRESAAEAVRRIAPPAPR